MYLLQKLSITHIIHALLSLGLDGVVLDIRDIYLLLS